MKKFNKVMSWDAETNGLWGRAFSIGAIVQNEDGTLEEFVLRCPIEGDVVPWVAENVLPAIEGIEVNCTSYHEMLEKFSEFLAAHKDHTTLVHMGHIVESKVIRDMHDLKIIGDWDAPYLWYDVCVLEGIGDSTDTFNREHGVKIPDCGSPHNPLYDSYSALLAYNKWRELNGL